MTILQRASEKTGFNREKYIDSKEVDKVLLIPFFGDLKHEFILSTLLLSKLKDRYLIVCGFPNRAGLFNVADEYWGLKDVGVLKSLAMETDGWNNTSQKYQFICQQLNKFFETFDDFSKWYSGGIKPEFLKSPIHYHLPALGLFKQSIPKGKKVLVYPVKRIKTWERGRIEYLVSDREFWEKLIERLLENKFVPIVYQDYFTYDLSPKYASKVSFFSHMKVLDQLALMRECLVLDIFSDLSKLALVARSSCICLTDRLRYIQDKDYEIDKLCLKNLPISHIFSFATMIQGKEWPNIIDLIMAKVKSFKECELPSVTQVDDILNYEDVKEFKSKCLGIKFLKVNYGS